MRSTTTGRLDSTPTQVTSVLSRRALHQLIAGAGMATALPWAQAQDTDASTAVLPLKAFAQLPAIQQVQLSPNGQYLAFLVNLEDDTVLVTRPLAGQAKITTLLKTDNQRFHFRWIAWVGDERVLASVRFTSNSRGAVETSETRLMSVQRDGTGLVVLNQQRDEGGYTGQRAVQFQDTVVDWLPDDGRNILLALGEGRDVLAAVYKVDVATRERRLVQAPRRDVRSWITDHEHRVRVGISGIGTDMEIIERPPGGEWRTLWRFARFSDAEVWPLGFGRNPQELWVQAWHEGHRAVFTVDLRDPALTRTLRVARPQVDVTAGLMRARSGEVVGLRSTRLNSADGQRADIWDEDLKVLAQAVDQQLPNRVNRFQGFSRDDQRYVLYSSGNGQPGRYYIGDRGNGSLALLGDTYPDLQAKPLAGKRAVRIQARDGLPLNAFLTQPSGQRAKGPLPMVLLPRGGPDAFDRLDFDPWTEMLASRGYLVVQVNFRGATGTGLAQEVAGLQRWGLEMQDDLADAVQWAVQQQLADPRRVAIAGGSFGGYAALMGAVKSPTTFRCAASFGGVTDLRDLVLFKRFFVGGSEDAEARIGKYWGDREQLRATSPVEQVARIQVPVLLVHGTADASVPVSQGQDMARALERAGKPVRYIEQKDGDHNLSRYSHRLEFFTALESFLAQHLAPTA
jgi:dipeptidyl aminopeptidase/acylaminoacyl peptidase